HTSYSLCFCSPIPQQLTSTLFPYTTLFRSHPHVFGGDETKTWDQLKQEENPSSKVALLLDSVISNGPSLQVAYQLQKKVAKVGFDWEAVQDIWDKFTEEKVEFLEALEEEDTDRKSVV